MNREHKETQMETPAEGEGRRRETAAPQPSRPARRTGPRQFLREVRAEMRRVAWPSRREVASYSLVVLVSVSLITVFIFGLDQAFGQLVLWIFG
mgnify:CR=1 FL=1